MTKSSIIKKFRIARLVGDLSAEPIRIEFVRRKKPNNKIYQFRSVVNGELKLYDLKIDEFEPILNEEQKEIIEAEKQRSIDNLRALNQFVFDIISKKPILNKKTQLSLIGINDGPMPMQRRKRTKRNVIQYFKKHK